MFSIASLILLVSMASAMPSLMEDHCNYKGCTCTEDKLICGNAKFEKIEKLQLPKNIKNLEFFKSNVVAAENFFAETAAKDIQFDDCEITLEKNSLAGLELDSLYIWGSKLENASFANIKAKSVRIDHCDFNKVNESAFANAQISDMLLLTYNKLNRIETLAFNGASISQLKIEYNVIEDFKPESLNPHRIEKLELFTNTIINMKPDAVKITNNIGAMTVSFNKFRAMQTQAINIFKGTNMKSFNFIYNQVGPMRRNTFGVLNAVPAYHVYQNTIRQLDMQTEKLVLEDQSDKKVENNYFHCDAYLCKYVPDMDKNSNSLFNLMLTKSATCVWPREMKDKKPVEVYYQFKTEAECNAAFNH